MTPAFVVRKLLWVALGALCGVFAVLLGVRSPFFAAVPAVCAAALCFCRTRPSRAAALSLCGAAAAMLWCFCYSQIFLSGADNLAGTRGTYTAVVEQSTTATHYGTMTPVRLQTERGSISAALYLDDFAFSASPGDELRGVGRFSRVAESFAERGDLYLRANGFYLVIRGSDTPSVSHPDSVPLRSLPAVWAEALRGSIRGAFPAPARGLFLTLVTGDDSELDGTLRDRMSTCGVLHAISLSGMHVALLTGLIILLCGRRRRLAALIGIPAIAAFVLLTGAAAATMRAAVMQFILLLAPLVRRQYDPLTGLSAAVLILLAQNPWCAANWGFQLSFTSTAGILLFTPALYARITPQRIRSGVLTLPLRYVTATLAVTLGANLLSLPLSFAYFGVGSVVAPIANVLILWAISVCFAGGLACALLGLFWMPGACAAASVLTLLYEYLALTMRLLAAVPHAAIYTASPYLLVWLYALYLLAFLAAMGRTRALPTLLGAALILAVCAGFTAFENAQEGFTALNVGQGQCLVAQRGGSFAVIDCGGDGDAGETAARYLISHGAKRVDALILTHFDADHVNGAAQLMARVPVDRLCVPENAPDSPQRDLTLDAATRAGVPVCFVGSLQTLPLGDGAITLYPPLPGGEDDNESGICALVSCGGTDALVTGDLPAERERALLRSFELPDLEVLLAGHHGASTSTGAVLLDALRPEVVLISVGRNGYGHPSPAVTERILRFGGTAYRTDQNGNLTVRW